LSQGYPKEGASEMRGFWTLLRDKMVELGVVHRVKRRTWPLKVPCWTVGRKEFLLLLST